jgi:hypothetical protein
MPEIDPVPTAILLELKYARISSSDLPETRSFATSLKCVLMLWMASFRTFSFAGNLSSLLKASILIR